MLQGYRLGISFPRRWERTSVDLVNMVCMVVPWYWRSEGLVNGLGEQGGRGQESSKGKDEGGEGRKEESRTGLSIAICYPHTSPLIYNLVSIASVGVSCDIVPNNLSDRAEDVDR